MRRILAYLSLAAVVSLACGCDFMRTLAGRPTSADIAAKKAAIEQFERSTANAAVETVRDTVAVDVAPAAAPVPSAVAKEERRSSLSHRCYIIVGVFAERSNAEGMVEKLASSGFPATLILHSNGKTTVGACPTDDPEEARKSLASLAGLSYVPDDAWILVNE